MNTLADTRAIPICTPERWILDHGGTYVFHRTSTIAKFPQVANAKLFINWLNERDYCTVYTIDTIGLHQVSYYLDAVGIRSAAASLRA